VKMLLRLARTRLTLFVAVATTVVGFAFGYRAGTGQGAMVLGAIVALLVLALTLNQSLGHYAGLVVGWLPFAGKAVLFDAGALPDVTAERLGLLLLTVLCVARLSKQRTQGWELGRALRTMAIAVLIAVPFLLQAALRATDVSNAVRMLLDSYLLPAIGFFATACVLWTDEEVDGFVGVALAGATGWFGVALVEFVTEKAVYSGIDYAALGRGYVRPSGPLLSPGALGWAAGAVAVVGLAWFLGRHKGRFAIIGISAALAAAVINLTRSCWLGAGVGVLICVFMLGSRSKWRLVLSGLVGAVGLWVLLTAIGSAALVERTGNEGTLLNRLTMYATAAALTATRPLTGVGLTMFQTLAPSSLVSFGDIPSSYGADVLAPHSSILLLAVEAGVVATALLVFAGFVLLRRAWAWGRMQGEKKWPAVAILGIIACTVINGLAMDLQLFWRAVAIVGVLLGVLFGRMVEVERETSQ